MRLQILVSTKDCKAPEQLKPLLYSDPSGDFLIVNQGEAPAIKASNHLRLLTMNEYGLSKSRNKAIEEATGDICLIADDDCIFSKDLKKTIEQAYQEFPDADVITFQIVKPDGSLYKTNYRNHPAQHNRLSILTVSSIEITFRRSSILKAGVRFDEEFGLGSVYPCAEENIFLSDCLKAGLKLYYYPRPIVMHEEESKGAELNKKNLRSKGAMFSRIYGILGAFVLPAFAFKKKKQLGSFAASLGALHNLWKGFAAYSPYFCYPSNRKRKDVAFIVPSLANVASVNIPLCLQQGLERRGYKCDVFYFDQKFGSPLTTRAQKINFFSKVNFENYKVVHTHGVRPDAFGFLKKPIRSSSKLISTLHSYINDDLSMIYGNFLGNLIAGIWKILLMRHDEIICLSKDAMNYYSKYLFNKNVSYVYSGTLPYKIDKNDKLELEPKGNQIFIGSVSRIVRIKGLDQIIKALKLDPNLVYLCVGDGPQLNELKDMAHQLGVMNQCKFFGHQDNVIKFFKAMDVYIIPSRSEGLGISLLEAISQHVPSVCSDIPIFHELFNEDEVSFFKLDDEEGLLKAIRRSYQNRDILTARAFERYKESFTTDAMIENYLKEYHIS